MKLMKSGYNDSQLFDLFNKDPISKEHFKRYLKIFDERLLTDYLDKQRSPYESGMSWLDLAY